MKIVFVSAKEKAKAHLSRNGVMACGMDQLEMLLHDAVEQFQLQAAAPAVVKTKESSAFKSRGCHAAQTTGKQEQDRFFRTFVKSICIKKRVENRSCLYCFACNSVMHVGQKNLIFGLSI